MRAADPAEYRAVRLHHHHYGRRSAALSRRAEATGVQGHPVLPRGLCHGARMKGAESRPPWCNAESVIVPVNSFWNATRGFKQSP